jgi:MATE family multidrug resistance protein
VFSFLVSLAVIRLTPVLHAHRIFRDFRAADFAKLREIYRLGLPIGLTMMFEATLFFSSNFIMGHFGLDYLAAHTIAMNVPSVTFMVPLGIAMASTVRVGLAAGAQDREAARRAGWAAMVVATGFMVITSVILWTWPFEIAQIYLPATAANMAALTLAVTFLHVAALFQIVDGIQVTAALALRGLKDARAPMWIAGASYWLAGFPTCLLFGYYFNMKGLGIWYGLAFGLAVAAVLMCWRFWWLSRDR